MKKTKRPVVYYGGVYGSPFSVDTEIEDLYFDFKNNIALKNETYLFCPAFTTWAKNKMVIKSPIDVSLDDNNFQGVESTKYVQWFGNEFFFFADDSVQMTVYPPFLERTNIQGVVGQFDIGKWFRPVNPASTLIDGQLNISKGQSLLYVGFDRPVDLQRVLFPEDVKQLQHSLNAYKQLGYKGSFVKLYRKFIQSRANKVLLNKIKKFNNIEENHNET